MSTGACTRSGVTPSASWGMVRATTSTRRVQTPAPPLVRAARWLKTRSVCPLCNREWEFAKIEKIATYGNLD